MQYTNRTTADEQEAQKRTEGRSEWDENERQPTDVVLVPTVPIEISLWSLGSFRLKGVTELMRVVQMVPASLEGRLNHLSKGALDKVCVTYYLFVVCLCVTLCLCCT